METPEFDFGDDTATRATGAPHSGELVGVELAGASREVLTSAPAVAGVECSDWEEVPQARFLSWSLSHQLAYCRDRDLDSAEHAESDADKQFHLQRAKDYDDDLRRAAGRAEATPGLP